MANSNNFPKIEIVNLIITTLGAVIGTWIAFVGIVIPLMQGKMDAQVDSIKTEIREMDRRYELRQAEAEKRMLQWQEQTDRYIDKATEKP